MNFLSLFILIPILMLGSLALSGNMKQIRSICRSFFIIIFVCTADFHVSGCQKQRRHNRNAVRSLCHVVCTPKYTLFCWC